MNSIIKSIVFILGLLVLINSNGYCQSKDPCKQGNDKLMDNTPSSIESYPSSTSETSVYNPSDPNEIIGTKGYDVNVCFFKNN